MGPTQSLIGWISGQARWRRSKTIGWWYGSVGSQWEGTGWCTVPVRRTMGGHLVEVPTGKVHSLFSLAPTPIPHILHKLLFHMLPGGLFPKAFENNSFWKIGEGAGAGEGAIRVFYEWFSVQATNRFGTPESLWKIKKSWSTGRSTGYKWRLSSCPPFDPKIMIKS